MHRYKADKAAALQNQLGKKIWKIIKNENTLFCLL